MGLVLRRWGKTAWQQVLTATFPIVILLVCMLARIDLGVRHILPIYPLLAIVGGYAVDCVVPAFASGRSRAHSWSRG